MEKEFVQLTEAKLLKQLGFDELCLAKYQKLSEVVNYQFQLLQKERNCNRLDTAISAPLYQQAFKFFRDKYNLSGYIESHFIDEWFYFYKIEGKDRNYSETKDYKTYEEAELQCFKKLIEIAKNNKVDAN